MLEFMVSHELFGRGRLVGIQGRQKQTELWENLKTLLNADGSGPAKDVRLWAKTWSDWKTNTRKKASQLRKEATGTGGGPPSGITLSAIEDSLLDFLGPVSTFGLQDVPESHIRLESSTDESTGEMMTEYNLSPNSGKLRPTETKSESAAGPSKVASNHSVSTPHQTGENGPAKKRKKVMPTAGSERLEAFVDVQEQQTLVLCSIDQSMAHIAEAMADIAKAQAAIANIATAMEDMAKAQMAIANALVAFINTQNQ